MEDGHARLGAAMDPWGAGYFLHCFIGLGKRKKEASGRGIRRKQPFLTKGLDCSHVGGLSGSWKRGAHQERDVESSVRLLNNVSLAFCSDGGLRRRGA